MYKFEVTAKKTENVRRPRRNFGENFNFQVITVDFIYQCKHA